MTQRIIGPKFQEAMLYAVEIHGGDLRKSTTTISEYIAAKKIVEKINAQNQKTT